MQHNSLYGSVNPNFSKSQDKPTANALAPPTPTIVRHKTPTVHFANNDLQSPTTVPPPLDTTTNTPVDNNSSPPSPTYLPFGADEDFHDDEIITTELVDFPAEPVANVCAGFSTINSTFEDNTAFHDLILDPSQYLSYNA